MNKRNLLSILATVLLVSLLLCAGALAESEEADTIRFLSAEGEVTIYNPAGEPRFAVANARFGSGEAIETGPDGYAAISLDDTRIVSLDKETRLEFVREGSHMKLTVVQGMIFVDVSEKLDENESLDIETTTLMVGIRGTMIAAGVLPEGMQQVMLLEGKTEINYQDPDGTQRQMTLSAGQMLESPQSGSAVPAVSGLNRDAISAFVRREINAAPERAERAREAGTYDIINDGPENGQNTDDHEEEHGDDWVYPGEVVLTAASATKYYDGEPLSRTDDVLVSGLPPEFSILVTSIGSQTEPGTSLNSIAGYAIVDGEGREVNSRFNVRTVNGQLTVNALPLTVWTGSAEKEYDGTPLTCEEARITAAQGYVAEQPDWTNCAVSCVNSIGAHVLCAASGNVQVYLTDPFTGEPVHVELPAGKRLTVSVREVDGIKTFCYEVVDMAENDIPEDILRLYAENPDMMTLACQDAGWDPELVQGLVSELSQSGAAEVETVGMSLPEDIASRLIVDSVDVRVIADSDGKDYNGRALREDEARYYPIRLPEITVRAIGTITVPGTVDNDYEIEWGEGVNPDHYVIYAELGTLTVTEPAAGKVFVCAGSAERPYDGTPLTSNAVDVRGLPEDFTWTAGTAGSRTDAGTGANTIAWYRFFTPEGEDATEQFKDMVRLVEGELKVTPAAMEIATGSAAKEYDGKPLTNGEVSVSGLAVGETIAVTATGTVTDVGRAENTCAIDWGSTRPGNYAVTLKPGTLEVTRNTGKVTFAADPITKAYDGLPLRVSTAAGGAQPKAAPRPGEGSVLTVHADGLPEGLSFDAEAACDAVRPGTYPCSVTVTVRDPSGRDVTAFFSGLSVPDGEVTIQPAELTVTTGSAEKDYDGTPLTCAEASLTGLVHNETATVAATGSLTAVGTADNTCEITWGTADPSNYAITERLGTLEVTANETAIVIEAASAEKPYDGTELTADSFTVENLPEGFEATATVTGSQTDAGTGENAIESYSILKDVEDVTAFFSAVTTKPGSLKVNPAPLTVKTESASKPYDGTALNCTDYTIEGLISDETIAVTCTGTITDVGTTENTCTVSFVTAKEGNYALTVTPGTLEVTANETAIVLTAASAEKIYDGTALTADSFTVENLPEGFTVTATASGSQTDAGTGENAIESYAILNDGEDVTAFFSAVATKTGSLKVNPATLTVKTESASKPYDGTALTCTEYTAEGLVSGETIAVTCTGTITDVGTAENTCTVSFVTAKEGNYDLTVTPGTLEVTVNETAIVLTAASAEKPYDGTALTADSFTVENLPEGFEATASVTGIQTDVGTGENAIESYAILKDGEDVSAFFSAVTTKPGTLKVNPAPLTVKTESASKPYDGTALTCTDYSIEGLVSGETIAVTCTGTITEVGTAENTCTVAFVTAKEGNYALTVTTGTLEVTANETAIVIEAASAEKPYDGTALTADSFTVENLPEGFTVTATASGSQTDAGTGENTIESYSILKDGEDVTAFFSAVTTKTGTLKVTPAPLTVKTESASKPYDGTALNCTDYSIEGLVSGETIAVTCTGTITDVGTAENTCTVSFVTAKEGNYALSVTPGTLEVTANETAIVLTAASNEKTYDGTALTADSFTVENLPGGFEATATVAGGQTDAGTGENAIESYAILKDGEDVTAFFNAVTTKTGTLKVNPAPLTVKTESASKPYDGTELTCTEYTAEGLVSGETIAVTCTGTITDVGTAENTCTVSFVTAKEGNYALNVTPGTLEVTANETAIVLTAASAEKTYDGIALTAGDFTVENLPEGFTVTATVTGSQTDAGTGENAIESYAILKDGEDVTALFSAVTTKPGSLKVNPAPLTVKTESASKPYDGTALNCTDYSIEGLVSGETIAVTCTGTITDVGTAENTCTVSFVTAKEGNYALTVTPGTLEVTANETAIVLTAASAEKPYDGTALTADDFTVENLPEDFTVTATASGSQTDAGTGENAIESYAIQKDGEDVSAFFSAVTTKTGSLKVNPAPLTVKTESASKPYDGTALNCKDYSIEGLVSGETIAVTCTGTITDVGTAENTCTVSFVTAKEGNYDLTVTPGTLEVTANETSIVLTADSNEKIYDGTALTADDFTVENLPEGFEATATVTGSQTDAGTGENTIESYAILKDGEDVTALFSAVTTKPGSLKVNPATLTVKTESASKPYDGTALTCTEYTAEGLVSGETIAVACTGTITDVGTAENTCTVSFVTAKEGNYALTVTPGTLEVTANETAIVIEAASNEKTYDGTALTADDFTVENLPEGFEATATVTGSQTDAGTGENTIESYAILKDGEDVTAFFSAVTTKTGSLKVNPAPLTVKTESASKAYDGMALTCTEYTAEGLVSGETIEVSFTGTITDVGTAENTCTVSFATAKEGNYALTVTPGTLEVTANETAIVLTADSNEKIYDGTALTADNFTVENLPEGFEATATVTGSQTDVGIGENAIESYAILKDGEDVSTFFSAVTTKPGTLKVNPAPLTVKTESASKPYDGTALTSTEYTAEGLVSDETIAVTCTGTITDVGTAENACTVSFVTAKEGNYDLTVTPGTLEVTANETAIVLTAASAEKIYDGTALTADDFTVENLPEGFTVTATVTGSQTDAGTGENTIESYAILKDGEDVSAFFSAVATAKGELKVTPKTITVKTETAQRTYDGTALTAPASITGLIAAHEGVVTVTAKGEQTHYGSSTNTCEIAWNGVNPDNYSVSEELGTLTIDDLKLNFTIGDVTMVYTSNIGAVPYAPVTLTIGNGPHAGETVAYSSRQFTASSATGRVSQQTMFYTLFTGDHIALGIRGMDKDVGVYTLTGSLAGVSGYETNLLDFGMSCGSAAWTVTPCSLTIKTGSASRAFNGQPLTSSEVTVSGLDSMDEDKVTVTATGAITDAGSKPNSYDIEWNGVKEANYAITENLGTLTVDQLPVTLSLTGSSFIYSGVYGSATPAVSCENTDYTLTQSEWTREDTAPACFINWGWGDVLEFRLDGFLDAGSHSCSVASVTAGGSTSLDNYAISYAGNPSDCAISKLNLYISLGADSLDRTYGAAAVEPSFTFRYGNGSHAGEYCWPDDVIQSEGQIEARYTMFTGDRIALITGGWNDGSIGTHTVTHTWSVLSGNEGNFTCTIVNDAYTVSNNEASVVITAGSAEKVYDGTALTTDEYKVEGLPEGFTLTAAVTGSRTDAGTGESAISGYTILGAGGVDATASFTDVATVKGELLVKPLGVDFDLNCTGGSYTGSSFTCGDLRAALATGGEAARTSISYDVEMGCEAYFTLPGGAAAVYCQPYFDAGVYTVTPEIEVTDGSAGNYSFTWSDNTLTITPKQITVVIAGEEGLTYTGGTIQPLVTCSGCEVAWLSDTQCLVDGAVIVTVTGMGKDADTYTLGGTAEVQSDFEGDYEVTIQAGTMTIGKAQLIVRTDPDSKAYDGTALTCAGYSVEGLMPDETITVECTGWIVDVGTAENTCTVTFDSAKESNYVLNVFPGTLKVTANDTAILITADSAEKPYDGTALTADGFTTDGLPAGFSCTAVVSGAQTDAGTGDNTVTGYAILRDGNDVTSFFTAIGTAKGTLKVTPKAVTVTTSDAVKEYDGNALTAAEGAEIQGLVGGETATVTPTGTITEVGTADNTYTIAWTTAKEGNYAVTPAMGTLTVNKNTTLIQIIAETKSMPYNGGGDLTAYNYTVEGLPAGFTLEAQVSGSRWQVGSSPSTVTGYTIYNSNGENRTGSFDNVQLVDGLLTVTKAQVSVTTGSGSKTYDGSPLDYSLSWTGIHGANSDKITFFKTQNATDADTYTATYGYTVLDESMYEMYDLEHIVEDLGTLVVNPAPLTVTTSSGEKTFDGTALTGTAEVTGFVHGESAPISTDASITDAGSKANSYVINWSGASAKEGNYVIGSESIGTLKVLPITTAITVTAGSKTKIYDGTPLTDDTYSVTGVPDPFDYEVTVEGSRTDAGQGTGENKVTSFVIRLDGRDVTANFTGIQTFDGDLNVVPCSLVVNAGGGNFEYSGMVILPYPYAYYTNIDLAIEQTNTEGSDTVTAVFHLLGSDSLTVVCRGYSELGTGYTVLESASLSGNSGNYSITYTHRTMNILVEVTTDDPYSTDLP